MNCQYEFQRNALSFQHVSWGSGVYEEHRNMSVDAAFQHTLWSVAPISSRATQAQGLVNFSSHRISLFSDLKCEFSATQIKPYCPFDTLQNC